MTRRLAGSLCGIRLQGAVTLISAIALALTCMACVGRGEASSTEFGRVLEEMQRAYAQIDHYAATFLMQERIDGELHPEQWLALKFRKPFKVYLRWMKGKNEGRQALYPAGLDGNELWVRVPMLVSAVTITLDPQSPRARKGSRHAITDVGIGRLLDFISQNAQRGLQRGELTIEEGGLRTTFDRPVQRYTLHLPNNPTKGYYCMAAILDVDRDYRLPIYAEIYDWDGRLVERYGYLDLRLNPGLTDEDFDPKNPDYGF